MAALLGAVALGLAPWATAAGLRDGLFKTPPAGRQFKAPVVARYMSAGGDTFVLDRSQPRPLLKFDDSPEVWVLAPQPAPRGDVIYKNELGEPVLRATHLGGVTLFSADAPNGEAVSLAGVASAIRLQVLSLQALSERLLQASFRSHRATGHGVVFQAEATPDSTAIMGDAAIIATIAFVRLAERPDGRAVLAGIGKVQLVEGKRATATLKNGVLWISVAPADGFSGRPSSDRIVQAMAQGRSLRP